MIENTLRTNFYIPKEAVDTGISIKLDSGKIAPMPDPVPFREIYVHDLGMQGLHLRLAPLHVEDYAGRIGPMTSEQKF